jgi:glycosyltransferase involved in cell wall biosynthesis
MSDETPSATLSEESSIAEPLVSVIIPVFNRVHLIGRAIASVFAQSYQRIEIIVVDDASSDGLTAALAELTDPRLRCIVHPSNRGAAAARNTGIAAATGEFVAFLDSDDVWFPEKLAHQVAAMGVQPPEVVGHVCAYECVKAGYRTRCIAPDWTPDTFRRNQLLGCTSGPGSTLLCRRAIFADVGPFDGELRRLEDWDWLLRLASKGYRLLASPAALVLVEVGPGAARRDIEAALRRIRDRHYAIIAREGFVQRRIFEATLHLEIAAAAFGEKAYFHALTAIFRSLAYYPLRGGAFYWWLMQRAAGAVGLGRTERKARVLSLPDHQGRALP